MLLDEKDWIIVGEINCELCPDSDMCDRVKYDCPKANFKTSELG